MRVLDLGCGRGLTPQKLGFSVHWRVIGLDVNYALVSDARRTFPHRVFVCAGGEKLPFAASTFDRVISNVALPYMNLAAVLAETYRVLAPGGRLIASLHPLSFTLAEFRKALPKPKPVLRQAWVLVNGVAFHIAGRNLGESFQTERGVRIALRRAKFADVSFRHDSKRWFVEATKPVELPSTGTNDAIAAA